MTVGLSVRISQPDNAYLLYYGKYHCTVDLLSYWLGFNQTITQICLNKKHFECKTLFITQKAAKGKQVKQEVCLYSDSLPNEVSDRVIPLLKTFDGSKHGLNTSVDINKNLK